MNDLILQPPDDLISSLQESECILFAGSKTLYIDTAEVGVEFGRV